MGAYVGENEVLEHLRLDHCAGYVATWTARYLSCV